MTSLFDTSKTLSHAQREGGTVFSPLFDANGLITVVTIEADTQTVLMVAHMNADALTLTLQTGIAHYWSRSRGKLWKKGETSGELQRVVSLHADCDQDALVLSIEQTGRGAACHTGRKTCFYRKVVLENGKAVLEDTGLPLLFDPNEVY